MANARERAPSVKLDWQSAEHAAAYKESRRPDRFKRYHDEERILAGWLAGLPAGASILDAPCGTGRWIPFLQPKGFRYLGGDVSLAMMEQAQKDILPSAPAAGFVNLDMEHLPFADGVADCVVIWRFLHHVTNAQSRVQILREAARVTRDRVLISFHHPWSMTHLRKTLDTWTGRKVHRGQAVSHWQLRREAESCGLELVETKSFGKFFSINWFAYLRKRAPGR